MTYTHPWHEANDSSGVQMQCENVANAKFAFKDVITPLREVRGLISGGVVKCR